MWSDDAFARCDMGRENGVASEVADHVFIANKA
jgi:hypothetical protein